MRGPCEVCGEDRRLCDCLVGSDPDMDRDEAEAERRFADRSIKGADPIKALAVSHKVSRRSEKVKP